MFTTFHVVVEARARELLGLPEDDPIGTTPCVGYPQRTFGSVVRKPAAEVLHWNRWSPR